MSRYETHYAGTPVDFLAEDGPLRAEEGFGSREIDSKQLLSIPPEGADIWSELIESEQTVDETLRHDLGSTAIHTARLETDAA